MFAVDPSGMTYWGFNIWDAIPSYLPAGTKCHFCQVPLDSLEMYVVLVEIAIFSHIGCLEKAVDKI